MISDTNIDEPTGKSCPVDLIDDLGNINVTPIAVIDVKTIASCVPTLRAGTTFFGVEASARRRAHGTAAVTAKAKQTS
ncbi:MAG: hypothetical protein C5B57_09975 [Blastocatellia bacterium]|nr:MAG: hypothetical protein C5B57_09975 [Blastocatellia bacterium]